MTTPAEEPRPKPHLHGTSDREPSLTPIRAALLAAVADPVRIEIMANLGEALTVGQLCARLEMAQPRISHHLSVLREVGLIVAEVRGRQRPHRWAPAPLGSDARRVQDLLRSWFACDQLRPQLEKAAAGSSIEDFLL
jgi:DNA-binding transcriptional ArsR family regulator